MLGSLTDRDFKFQGCTLPETNIFAKNGWLEYDPFLLGRVSAYFQRRLLLVSGRVYYLAKPLKHQTFRTYDFPVPRSSTHWGESAADDEKTWWDIGVHHKNRKLYGKIGPLKIDVGSVQVPWWCRVSPFFEGCFRWWKGKPWILGLSFPKQESKNTPHLKLQWGYPQNCMFHPKKYISSKGAIILFVKISGVQSPDFIVVLFSFCHSPQQSFTLSNGIALPSCPIRCQADSIPFPCVAGQFNAAPLGGTVGPSWIPTHEGGISWRCMSPQCASSKFCCPKNPWFLFAFWSGWKHPN